jgi:hypothetical protein
MIFKYRSALLYNKNQGLHYLYVYKECVFKRLSPSERAVNKNATQK